MRTYTVTDNGIEVICPGFDLELTLDCGQSFLRPLKCFQDENGVVTLVGVTESEFLTKWDAYFDFNTDYAAIKAEFAADSIMREAMEYCSGIHLLKQDEWEALVSFTISQNNNIPRIKGILTRLTEHFGHFPSVSDLANSTPESLSFARAGFRAKYLCGTAAMIASGEVSLQAIHGMNTETARRELQKLPGVGPKVAECTLLYGYGRHECFPVDVWIKRALAEFYPGGFPFMNHPEAGVAQQYLFHYIRSKERELIAV